MENTQTNKQEQPWLYECRDLCKVYKSSDGEVRALNHLQLNIPEGGIFGIIGLSGAGKSTLIRCLNGLERPDQGEVLYRGRNLAQLTEPELRLERRQIGMIFQHFNLLKQRNVLANITLPLEIAGWSKEEAERRAYELLARVDLLDKAKRYPAELSGGQQQRVAIARALAASPRVLLCDEATSALDPKSTQAILELLRTLQAELAVTVVMISHELAALRTVADQLALLHAGRVVESGSVDQVFQQPRTPIGRELLQTAAAWA